jgi:hypothetical protein
MRQFMVRFLPAVLPLLGLGMGGCGGTLPPGVPGTGVVRTRIVLHPPTDQVDGYSDHDGSGYDDSGTELQVGTTVSGQDDVVIGFVSFDLPPLEVCGTTRLLSARLRLYLASMVGDPFSRFLPGGIHVDHIDYGATFDFGSDFYMPFPDDRVLHEDIGVLATDGTPGWRELDVTEQVRFDYQRGRQRSQFGLHFLWDDTMADPDGDDAQFNDEYVLFEDAGNHQGTGNLPELVLEVITVKGEQP